MMAFDFVVARAIRTQRHKFYGRFKSVTMYAVVGTVVKILHAFLMLSFVFVRVVVYKVCIAMWPTCSWEFHNKQQKVECDAKRMDSFT